MLLKLGTLHYRRHEAAAAVQADKRALEILEEAGEDWLRAYAHYNLAHHLHADGETERAEAELAAHEKLIESATPQLANLLVWLRARIAWTREDLALAKRLFAEARKLALERGIRWDAGLIALELALVELVQGRSSPAGRLAEEALAVFSEQKVEREIRGALDLVEAAVRQDALTRAVLEQAVAALERSGAPRAAPSEQPHQKAR